MTLEEKVWRYLIDHGLLQEGDRVLVAVSGGPDSLCLMHILYTFSPRFKLRLITAHLNHGFRPEASQEAEMVQALAFAWSLPFEGAFVDVPAYAAGSGLSAQEAARTVRYRFLLEAAEKHGASKIAVGHHMDDQAETILFNLFRGTGLDGLAGMKPCRQLGAVELIRPLLGVTRQEIENYCLHHGLEPVHDPSNLKTTYTRNRIRLELIPYLERHFNPNLKETLERTADLVAADRDYLEKRALEEYVTLSREKGNRVILDKAALIALPRALQGRVVKAALEYFVPEKVPGWLQVKQVLALALARGRGRRVELPGGVMAYSSYRHLVFARQSVRRKIVFEPRLLRVPGDTELPLGGYISAYCCEPAELVWPPRSIQAYLDYHLLPEPLVVRGRWPGARFHPQGSTGGKKLKDFFIDSKVAVDERESRPLVTAENEIIWVAGLRIAHPYRVTEKTEKVLVLEWKEGDQI